VPKQSAIFLLGIALLALTGRDSGACWCTADMSRTTAGLREVDWQPGAMDISLVTRAMKGQDTSSRVEIGNPKYTLFG